jgi:hypothetical protein
LTINQQQGARTMKKRTPAIRLHKLAARHDMHLEEFSPGLRVWAIWKRGQRYADGHEPLAWAVPHGQVADRIEALSRTANHLDLA